MGRFSQAFTLSVRRVYFPQHWPPHPEYYGMPTILIEDAAGGGKASRARFERAT
jgi:hypothetical protein